MKRILLTGVFVVTLGAILGMASFLLYRHFNPPTPVLSYTDCTKQKGSVIQERYPATCITREGIQFVQPVIFTTATPAPSPVRTEPTPKQIPGYSCPETAWVDCMPGPGPVKHECTAAYLGWATAHCPGFQGAAY